MGSAPTDRLIWKSAMSSTVRKIAATTPLVAEVAEQIGPAQPESAEDRNLLMTFEFAKFVNVHTTDYIRMADGKAAILVTLLSANLLVLVQKAGQYIAEGHTAWRLALVLVAVLFATISLSIAIHVIRPRTFQNAKKGHLFWEDITAQDKAIYAESFQQMKVTEICRELGDHNHNLANSAIRKFKWLRIGFVMAMVSVGFSAAIILLTSA
jgi:hypothetical protein